MMDIWALKGCATVLFFGWCRCFGRVCLFLFAGLSADIQVAVQIGEKLVPVFLFGGVVLHHAGLDLAVQNGDDAVGTRSESDLKKLVPHARVLKGLAVRGTSAGGAEKTVEKWLEGLGNALIETTTGNPAIYPDGAY